MTHRAILFDIDGTLVDSNYLHVEAWSRAFDGAGVPVEAWRIHRSIGMDGDQLLESLLADADDLTRTHARELHSVYYRALGSRLRPFEGARELLERLTDDGFTVVLATSAPQSELASLREVLRVEDAIDVVTSADDVETAKPAPDIVEVALERADVAPDNAIMVGDTVWDMKAATQAGVGGVGVQSGGFSQPALLHAGALAVYENVADLLAKLAGSPLLEE
ncbi:MAG TPA: HAD family hydrolase [Galbitalea sp.]|nr:HAD family hydrolase [Galbitalea sp.]